MNAVTTTNGLDPRIIESLVLGGDVGKLTPAQKLQYVAYRCKQVGLDPAAQPFQLLRLQGKEVLYATAGATQQLCQTRGLSVQITKREKIEDIYCVEARVTDKEGRFSENMGSVPIGGLKGDVLSNALLKATTKAIRRTVLAHCGLGVLDELEAETIPGAQMQRGNPLRAEYQAFGHEIDAAKSKEQIDLILGSPEFSAFQQASEEQAKRGGMDLAGAIMDQADARRGKLPETVEISECQQREIEEYKNAAQSAPVAPAVSSVLIPPQEPSQPPDIPPMLDRREPEFSAICTKIMEQFDIVDDADGFKAAQKFALEHQKELTPPEKKALNELSRRVGARLREAA